MGYRLYATCAEYTECFGKLFGYRSDYEEKNSIALYYLLNHSSFIEDNFDEDRAKDKEHRKEIVDEIVDMFDSDYHFECQIDAYEFLQFIVLYILEGSKRWERIGEPQDLIIDYLRNMTEKAQAFCSHFASYALIKLKWE